MKKRLLIYKRTHKGDPNPNGVFGCNDCMKEIRSWRFDTVIGIGGKGQEARKNDINHKVNWVGIGADKSQDAKGLVMVNFKDFRLFEETGVPLAELALKIAKRFY